MTASSLVKVWTAVHLFAIYTGVNALLAVQNSPFLLPLLISTRDETQRGPDSMALFWFYVSAPAVIVSMLLATAYLRMPPSKGGVSKAPSMFGVELARGSRLATAYLAFWLIVCTSLSTYGSAHAAKTVLEADIFECKVTDSSELRRLGAGALSGMVPRFGESRARFDGCAAKTASPAEVRGQQKWRGVQYIPIVNDLLVAALALSMVLTVFVFWLTWARQSWRNRMKLEPDALGRTTSSADARMIPPTLSPHPTPRRKKRR